MKTGAFVNGAADAEGFLINSWQETVKVRWPGMRVPANGEGEMAIIDELKSRAEKLLRVHVAKVFRRSNSGLYEVNPTEAIEPDEQVWLLVGPIEGEAAAYLSMMCCSGVVAVKVSPR